MALSTSPALTAATSPTVASNRLDGVIGHLDPHLMTRFRHVDPALVEDYMAGRRRQVSPISLD